MFSRVAGVSKGNGYEFVTGKERGWVRNGLEVFTIGLRLIGMGKKLKLLQDADKSATQECRDQPLI